jgi:hypothetical protein
MLENQLIVAVVVVLVVVVAAYSVSIWDSRGSAAGRATDMPSERANDVSAGQSGACRRHNRRGCHTCARRGYGERPEIPEQPGVYESLSRLYSTADVDPLITGNLYAHNDFVRNVYAERTSHGDVHGLTEYSSSGGPGDVGVDIGPFGMAEYGGREFGFDDGIPEEYGFPSTPVRWYAPEKRDYYGPDGPTPYTEGLYPIQEPDHDPYMN